MFVNKLWQFNLPKPTCCSSSNMWICQLSPGLVEFRGLIHRIRI